MNRKKTVTRRPQEAEPPAGAPAPGSASDTMARARAYGDVAREAQRRCERGADAESEIHKRRQASGE